MTATLPAFSTEEGSNDKEENEQPTAEEIRAWREQHPCDLKLFGATVMFDSRRRGKIKLNLYIEERDQEFPFPYDCMIYEVGCDDWDMGHRMEYITESFTQTEIDAVQKFLEQPDMPFSEFHSYEVDLPITMTPMPQGLIGGGSGEEDYSLWKMKGYSLPFHLVGHSYDPVITNALAYAMMGPAPDENRTPEQSRPLGEGMNAVSSEGRNQSREESQEGARNTKHWKISEV